MYELIISIRTLIYIPLCFYLYLFVAFFALNVADIYIPLCFYLYQTPFCLIMTVLCHLHSTMLLHIRGIQFPVEIDFFIYIPLCFYLYIFRSRKVPKLETYLHSTMLLLIRWKAYSTATGQTNLHSTMLLLIRRDIY